LRAEPDTFDLRGKVVSPAPELSGRYTFCESYPFKAVFYNVQRGMLHDPVLQVTLDKGMKLISGSFAVAQDGNPNIAIKKIIGDTVNTNLGGRIINIYLENTGILDPTVELPPYGSLGDSIVISFDVKVECGFTSGQVFYMYFSANSTCGDYIGEIKNSLPFFIDGADADSKYEIDDFIVTGLDVNGALNLSNATAAAASMLNVKGTIQLISDTQSPGDSIALSIPPNMDIISNNTLKFNFN
jgi:hypothetical protein